MKILVTGATGLIGNAVAKRLADPDARNTVRALVRDPARAKKLLPGTVELVVGDITDEGSVRDAVRGVEAVFHAAGMPEQWHKDDLVFDRVNRGGTKNVLRAALSEKVGRVVYTSTMDVFAATPGGTLVEANIDTGEKPSVYERSKQAAEREAEAVRKEGLDVVFLNPSAVYGPSPVHIALNSFFVQLLNGKMPLVPPGGMSIAYVDGVADAHVAALERGKDGERYLLADCHASNAELAAAILAIEGKGRKVPKVAPVWLMKAIATISAPFARALGFTPLIAPGQLSFLLWNPQVDASKAARELGFVATPLAEGAKKTIDFLRAEGLVPVA
jgi:nucleoside-diphosphate-sugar epimerase